jgi:hypothetical protein
LPRIYFTGADGLQQYHRQSEDLAKQLDQPPQPNASKKS